MNRSKMKVREQPPVTVIGIGTALAIMIGILLMAVLAYLMIGDVLPYEQSGSVISVIHFVSVLCGGLFALLTATKKSLLMPLLVALCYVLLLMGSNILLLNDGVHFTWGTMLAAAGAIGVNALVLLRNGSRGGRKKHFR